MSREPDPNTSLIDAYIYDGIRTPFGRHAGTLASVRPDDLLGDLVAALVDRSPFRRRGLRRPDRRLCEPGRRGLPQRGATGQPAGGFAGRGGRDDGQTACAPAAWQPCWDASRAIACGQGDLFHRGRRGEHESRAVRHGEGGEGRTADS